MSKIENLLGKPTFIPRDNVPDYLRTVYLKDQVLEAMKEIASAAFDAGQKNANKNIYIIQSSCMGQSGIKRDFHKMEKGRQQYISKLFEE